MARPPDTRGTLNLVHSSSVALNKIGVMNLDYIQFNSARPSKRIRISA